MIHQIKLQLGSGLYTGGGKEKFHKLFMKQYEHEFIFSVPSPDPLITTIFWLKQTMWNHIDSLKWKKT